MHPFLIVLALLNPIYLSIYVNDELFELYWSKSEQLNHIQYSIIILLLEVWITIFYRLC